MSAGQESNYEDSPAAAAATCHGEAPASTFGEESIEQAHTTPSIKDHGMSIVDIGDSEFSSEEEEEEDSPVRSTSGGVKRRPVSGRVCSPSTKRLYFGPQSPPTTSGRGVVATVNSSPGFTSKADNRTGVS